MLLVKFVKNGLRRISLLWIPHRLRIAWLHAPVDDGLSLPEH